MAGSKSKIFDANRIANKFVSKHHVRYIPLDGPYLYQGGVYSRATKKLLERLSIPFMRAEGFQATRHQRGEVVSTVELHDKVFREDPNPDTTDKINVVNGLLDPFTGKLTLHTADLFIITQLNVSYDPDATAPVFMKFIEEIQPDPDMRKQVQEFYGSTVWPETSIYEKGMIGYGTGSNGKSRLQMLMENIIGEKNVSSESLHSIGQDFHLIQTRGKLLNAASETPDAEIVSSETFKKMISGDLITDSYKGAERFSWRNYAKLVFLTNELPRIVDDTDGMWRKLLIIEFPRKFEGENKDVNILKKMIAEKSGVFNWMLDGLRRLVLQGGFTESARETELREKYRRACNPVALFVDDFLETEPEYEEQKSELYSHYRTFCKDNGFMPLNNVNFFKKLRAILPDIEAVQHRVGDGRSWYMAGVRLV